VNIEISIGESPEVDFTTFNISDTVGLFAALCTDEEYATFIPPNVFLRFPSSTTLEYKLSDLVGIPRKQ